MLFKYRPARLEDLDQCLTCIRDQYTYTPDERVRLLAYWRRLLQTGAGNLAVIEDATAPSQERIIWFCCAAFVAPEYAQAMRDHLPPFLGKRGLRQWEAGRCPLLTRNQVAAANSGSGLHAVVLNSGPSPRILQSLELWNQLAAKVVDFGAYHLQGYRMSELLIEVYTPFTYDWCESGGLDLATDYTNRTTPEDESLAATGGMPRLYHLTAERSQRRRGAVMGALFQYTDPCFFFTAIQQEFLLYALTGETDEEIARNLRIAPATVRKRWNGIYERIADSAPDALGQEAPPSRDGRGSERKRLLISYLRHHMEELRPLMPILAPWPHGLAMDGTSDDALSLQALFASRPQAPR